MKQYVVQKRVANTEHWGTIADGHFDTRDEAIEAAYDVDGGPSTGVRIIGPDGPWDVEVVVGC